MADKTIKIKLAHPITKDQAARAGVKDVKDYPSPGAEVEVTEAGARSLIDAGYAAYIDPQDHEAVLKALQGTAAAKSMQKSPSPSS